MKIKSNVRKSGEGVASTITDGLGLTGTEARRGFGDGSSSARAVKLWAAS